MTHTYIIIDDNHASVGRTSAMLALFPAFTLVGSATNYEDGLNLILEHNPQIVFLEIDPEDKQSRLSLALINELYRYLTTIPRIVVTTTMTELAYEAIRHEVFDYLVKPIDLNALRRTLLKLTKNADVVASSQPISNSVKQDDSFVSEIIMDENLEQSVVKTDVEEHELGQNKEEEFVSPPLMESTRDTIATGKSVEKPLIICVKSYGDYRFIEARDITYLKADNNSTDIHLVNGEMITAFKTLKHFETLLIKPFTRIHNSYIVNIDQVSRIHTGNSVCYIKGTTTKIPFSKSYKDNIDDVINYIANGNYLEF